MNTMESSNSGSLWGDCVILPEDLWEELDEFRRNLISLNCSVVEEVEFLTYWSVSKAFGMKATDIIDRSYLLMSPLN